MSSETTHEIPEQIREIMQDGEIGNMRNLCGWAVGRVARQDTTANPDGPDIEVLDEAWIELFNGKGRAGEFGGVRFMAVDDDGEYREAYAYPSRKDLFGNEPGWYVQKFYQPTNPEIGIRKPTTPGVQ